MKNKFAKGFTLIDSLFALIILSIISTTLIFGISTFSKYKLKNMESIDKINRVELVFNDIRENIKSNRPVLDNISSDFKIDVLELDEMYYIKVDLEEMNEKSYELYIRK